MEGREREDKEGSEVVGAMGEMGDGKINMCVSLRTNYANGSFLIVEAA